MSSQPGKRDRLIALQEQLRGEGRAVYAVVRHDYDDHTVVAVFGSEAVARGLADELDAAGGRASYGVEEHFAFDTVDAWRRWIDANF